MPDTSTTDDADHQPNSERAAAFRIIDANGNRAVEGLRVLEDYLRFHRCDVFLSQSCKQIRHDVSKTLASLFGANPVGLTCRSTQTDIGTTTETPTEYDRPTLQHIARANLSRTTEALRTLEEYSKLVSRSAAKEFEALRYRTYTLQKSIGHLERAKLLLDSATLYVLIDLRFGAGATFTSRVRTLIDAGADVIQLRDKNCSDRQLIEAGHLVRRLTREVDRQPQQPLFIINDRPDVARVTMADGVHVGQEEMSVADTRLVVGAVSIIGVSTHTIEQAKQAVVDGADYIGVGPVFESSTKSFEQFVGTELVAEVSAEIGLPAYAIGGITSERLRDVLASGANRVAVSSAIWQADDVGGAVREFRKKLDFE